MHAGFRTLAALALLAAAAAPAGAKVQVGDPAPWPEARETIGISGYDPASLDGKVVFIEVFRTW
jgi:hypothetical protein